MKTRKNTRKGTVAVLLCMLMMPLLALLAFSIDYGFLLFVRTDLQRVADQAVLAAVRDLTPDAYGNQDLQKVRDRVREYLELNLGTEFVVNDSDIEIGRFDPATIYTSVDLLSDGIFDSIRVNLRRDDFANQSVTLYFARLFGDDEADVSASATAVLQKARFLPPGSGVLPIALEQTTWSQLAQGATATVYGDGRIEDEFGKAIPGNWGTVDIGPNSNSTAELSYQIENGLLQSDLDALNALGSIPTTEYIDAGVGIDLNGETGLSAGLKFAIWEVEGTMKVAPIYGQMTGGGGGLNFDVVEWVTVEVVNSSWKGAKNSSVTVRKSYTYDGYLLPALDLQETVNIIQGAYTSPVLVQ